MGTIRQQDIIIKNLKAENERNKEVARELSLIVEKFRAAYGKEDAICSSCQGIGRLYSDGLYSCDDCGEMWDSIKLANIESGDDHK
jgi:hypothetical protein